MAFGGYSVTAGRGNLFNQSYPFVVKRLLDEPMKNFGISSLEIRNAAIGGIPSFPFAWCLENFLGDDADLVSWDFSMSEAIGDAEGGTAEGLEAYIRHVHSMNRSPMLLVLDTFAAKERRQLLSELEESGINTDTLVVHSKRASESLVSLSEDIVPLGFSDWRKWGAPLGAPGQAPHHPAFREHELIAWIIAMHFLSAIELADACLDPNIDILDICNKMQAESKGDYSKKSLPSPSTADKNLTEHLTALFYGHPVNEKIKSSLWTMYPVSCFTSFQPALGGALSSLITGGTANTRDLDVMLVKGSKFYNSGWVLDLSPAEKKAKRLVERYSTGHIDSKQAYYGVAASGALKLFLPVNAENLQRKDVHEGTTARTVIQSVVVCQVNEVWGTKNECLIETDVDFRVGGIKASHVNAIKFRGAAYLGKPICVDIGLPEEWEIASDDKGNLGILMEISVSNRKVNRHEGPCSVAHVVCQYR